jgi:hypothetical protein
MPKAEQQQAAAAVVVGHHRPAAPDLVVLERGLEVLARIARIRRDA